MDQNKIRKSEAEGGCGVIGIACSEKIAGRHLLSPLKQLCNRGNGKGGGIAAAGLDHRALGVSQEVLDSDYLLAIGYLESSIRKRVEEECILPTFEIDHVHVIPNLKHLPGLDTRPPEAIVYFVRVKKEISERFRTEQNLAILTNDEIEDEIVYRNSNRLNSRFYEVEGEKRAFVLSHGKNLLVLKMVAYGHDVITYYQLESFPAHVWIGHHRYPTKGKVWHPGGSHPFIGLHEALVHNGDFANYSSMVEYLAQKNIHPHFHTDTEVAALVFDLLTRKYKYPLEYAIECLAPTTERDFSLLPLDKQKIYGALQRTHIHGSPDGPWFFLIAQSLAKPTPTYRLIGITDTSMLRPQVFALQEGEASIGLASSEKQAIDAALESLSAEDSRFWGVADRYWNARGGSHTDGGAFMFTVGRETDGSSSLRCTDKFGGQITMDKEISWKKSEVPKKTSSISVSDVSATELFLWTREQLKHWDEDEILSFLQSLEKLSSEKTGRRRALETLTLLMDRHYPTGKLRRSRLLSFYHLSLLKIVEVMRVHPTPDYLVLDRNSSHLPDSKDPNETLVIDSRSFPSEGPESLALAIVRAHRQGYWNFLIVNCRGQRFIANGLGGDTKGLRIDVYGSSGDYIGSGINGAEVHIHGSAQDQAGQILKDGTLVIHGDVGQTFLYAAKGGKAFVLGNAAGRPLINSVGNPRVVINGTCLDYLAESFMAGNPLDKGGFAVLNGLAFDEEGKIVDLEDPYPGGNLFSLPSGGAIYIRDPENKISKEQLNGGEIVSFAQRDWNTILPLLEENAVHFDIPVERLLEHRGQKFSPHHIYRKISPGAVRALEPEEAWVSKKS